MTQALDVEAVSVFSLKVMWSSIQSVKERRSIHSVQHYLLLLITSTTLKTTERIKTQLKDLLLGGPSTTISQHLTLRSTS